MERYPHLASGGINRRGSKVSRRKGITFVHLSNLVFVERAHPEEHSFTDLVGRPLAPQLATSPAPWGALASSPLQKQSGSSPALGHSTTAIAL